MHAVEASPTPERALASAARLETLVPGAGHLVHMPTHIYIHTGHIGRVAELNAKAAAADERYIEVAKPEGLYPFMYYGHNVHFVVVGNILIGRYEDALKAGRADGRTWWRRTSREMGADGGVGAVAADAGARALSQVGGDPGRATAAREPAAGAVLRSLRPRARAADDGQGRRGARRGRRV